MNYDLLTHRTCSRCGIDDERAPEQFSGSETNFIDEDGKPNLLCYNCWEDIEGYVCEGDCNTLQDMERFPLRGKVEAPRDLYCVDCLGAVAA